MVKLIALYTQSDDLLDFERRYFQDYLPVARRLPGLIGLETARITGTPWGDAPYHLITEFHFADRESLDTALASTAWKETARASAFASGLGTLLFAQNVD